ncbi:MAG: hypothetical protein HY717_16245 [Planctomycetes bacterium]|nr:hypothetical protein [Planctomycetota bacterium]
MTRLLVSARNAREARLALESGAGIIDLKEPANGPLGMAEIDTIRAAVEDLRDHVPVAVSLGEFRDWRERPGLFPDLPPGIDYLKVGLSGLGEAVSSAAFREEFSRWRDLDPNGPHRSGGPAWVAVLYADWEAACGPRPDEALHLAAEGFGALLVDTFRKDRGPDALFRCLSEEELKGIVAAAHDRGLEVVLAGSLTAPGVRRAAALGPDAVGVRGAACRGGRGGEIDPQAIQRLVRALA